MAANEYVDEVLSDLFGAGTDPRVRVIGLGGAGGNVVSALPDRERQSMETVVLNADATGLERARADQKIRLDLGDAWTAESVTEAVEALGPRLRQALSSELVFVVGGFGGATGTGAMPPVCRAAREAGAVVMAIAVLPFRIEGGRRTRAEAAVEGLRRDCDSVLLVDNESVCKFDGRVSLKDAFGLVNALVARLVSGVLAQIRRDFYVTLQEEVEVAAREIEAQEAAEIATVAPPSEVVEARGEIAPVGFDSSGFLGWR
jgi:cell division protein FtsZ